MKKISLFLILVSSFSFAKAESLILECKTNSKVLVSKYWKNTDIRDYKNAGIENLLIFISNNSLTIDGVKLEKLKQRFRSDDGYEEYGDFVKTETDYDGFKFVERGEEGPGYSLLNIKISIGRLDGMLYYSKSSYVHDVKNSQFKKFNSLNIKSGFVNSIHEGKCLPSKQKRLF